MPRKQVLERDAERDIGAELLQSVREMNAGLGKVSYRIKVPNATTLAAASEAEKIIQIRSVRIKNVERSFHKALGLTKNKYKPVTLNFLT